MYVSVDCREDSSGIWLRVVRSVNPLLYDRIFLPATASAAHSLRLIERDRKEGMRIERGYRAIKRDRKSGKV